MRPRTAKEEEIKKKWPNQPRMRKPRWSNRTPASGLRHASLSFFFLQRHPANGSKAFFFLHKGRFNNRKIQIKKALQNGRAFLCYLQSGDSFGAHARALAKVRYVDTAALPFSTAPDIKKKLTHHNASGAEARARNHLYSR